MAQVGDVPPEGRLMAISCEHLKFVSFKSILHGKHEEQYEEIRKLVRAATKGKGENFVKDANQPVVFIFCRGKVWLNHSWDSVWVAAVQAEGYRGRLMAVFKNAETTQEWIGYSFPALNLDGRPAGDRGLVPAEMINLMVQEHRWRLRDSNLFSNESTRQAALKASIGALRKRHFNGNTAMGNVIRGAADVAATLLLKQPYSTYYEGIICAAVDAASRRSKQHKQRPGGKARGTRSML